MLIALVFSLALSVAILAAIPALGLREKGSVRSTLRVALEPARGGSVEAADDRKSLRERVLEPLSAGATRAALRFTPKGYLDNARARLARSGRPQQVEFERFLVTRLLSLGLIPVVLVLVGVAPLSRRTGVVFFLFVAVLCLLGPEASLNRRISQRQDAIRRELADLIDLLNIGVQAGLSFEQALSRTTVAVPGELSEEFARMLSETRLGVGRKEAFEGVIERTDVPELRRFLLALAQAEEFGISIVQILASQSVEMRTERRQRAQEKAQKAPVKMMFPLVFCILPALFIVVVGPAAMEIYRTVIK